MTRCLARQAWAGYALAVVGTAGAALVRWGLGRAFPGLPPYITFYPVVVLSAILGGTAAGVLATVLGALATNLLFQEPVGRLSISSASDAVGLALFVAVNLGISVVGGRLRVAHRRARAQTGRAVAQARELKESLRLLDLANVLVLDPDSRITRWTTGCQRLYGFSAAQALGRVSHELLQTRFPEPREAIRAALEAQGRWQGELVHTAADGRAVVVTSEWVLWRDAGGAPAAILEVNTDATGRQEAEAALADSRQRLAAIIESAMDALITLDEQQRIVLFNPAAEKMFRCPAAEALGSPIDRFIPARFRATHREDVRQFGHTGQTARAMGRLQPLSALRADGEEFPMEASISHTQVAGQTLFTVILRDITQRQAAEGQLRLQSAALTAVGNGITITDTAGHIKWVNPAFTAITGYSLEEVRGRNPRLLKSGQQDEAYYRDMWATILSGHVWHGELVNRRKDGSLYVEEMTIAPVPEHPKPVEHFVAVKQDITARKRAEAALRQREQELAELNRTLEQRIARRTAEIERRSAQLRHLNAALTQAEQRERRQLATMLHDGLQQLLVAAKLRLGATRDRAAGEVRAAVEEVDGLLSQSIDASRTLTVELFPPVLHDRGLVPALHWLARHMYERQKLAVEVLAALDSEPPSEDVRVLLFQATRELLFNVVKHAGVGEALVVLRQGDGVLRLEVSDGGKGFDPATVPGMDGKPGAFGGGGGGGGGGAGASGGGRGFGLFSVQQRLEWLGGEVEVQSAPGQGTRVTLTVPLPSEVAGSVPQRRGPGKIREAARMAPGPRPGEEAWGPSAPAPGVPVVSRGGRSEGRRLRVLLADDHKIVRDGIALLLREQPDVEVVGEASDGEMAVALARELRPDAVVMDISMPKLDGVEATSQIVGDQPGVCVIGLSMHDREDVAAALRQAGAAAYLPKASAAEALLATLRQCCAAGE